MMPSGFGAQGERWRCLSHWGQDAAALAPVPVPAEGR